MIRIRIAAVVVAAVATAQEEGTHGLAFKTQDIMGRRHGVHFGTAIKAMGRRNGSSIVCVVVIGMAHGRRAIGFLRRQYARFDTRCHGQVRRIGFAVQSDTRRKGLGHGRGQGFGRIDIHVAAARLRYTFVVLVLLLLLVKAAGRFGTWSSDAFLVIVVGIAVGIVVVGTAVAVAAVAVVIDFSIRNAQIIHALRMGGFL